MERSPHSTTIDPPAQPNLIVTSSIAHTVVILTPLAQGPIAAGPRRPARLTCMHSSRSSRGSSGSKQ